MLLVKNDVKLKESGGNLDLTTIVNLFLKAKKAVRDLTETAKRDYFKDKLSSCSDKDIYRTIDSLLNKQKSDLPFYDSPSLLSTQFSKYFVDKIQKIRDELDNTRVMPVRFKDNISEGITVLEFFRPCFSRRGNEQLFQGVPTKVANWIHSQLGWLKNILTIFCQYSLNL